MQVGKTIYLDYQATTPLDKSVYAEMQPYYKEAFANPHSSHVLGQQAGTAIQRASEIIEGFVGAQQEEIIFTSGATESNNQAIFSVLAANKTSKNKILINATEHKCVKNAAYYFAKQFNCQVKEIPVDETGTVNLEAYNEMLTDDVLLVCIMSVNNEIGSINDIKQLTKLAHNHGALFLCDAAQAPIATDIDVKDWDVDLMSLSGHKIYGPKGIGAIYIKNELQAILPALIQGGGQQYGMRSGTLATPLCVGFGKAFDVLKEDLNTHRQSLLALRATFLNNLEQAEIDYKINGQLTGGHPGNLNIEFLGVDTTKLVELIQPEVCASTGSACNSEMVLHSHVLQAIGLSEERITSSLRFSFGKYTTHQQIEQAVAVIANRISSAR